jgi:hypothetical protein
MGNKKSKNFKSTLVPVRLRADEIHALDDIRQNVNGETLNRSEMIRSLIVREYVRRSTGKSEFKSAIISSDFRHGRPSNTNQPPAIPLPTRKSALRRARKAGVVPSSEEGAFVPAE